jgi:hypothetical protein
VFDDYAAMGPLEDDKDFTNHKTMHTIEDDKDSASINLEDIKVSVESCMNCKHEQIELRVAERDYIHHGSMWSLIKWVVGLITILYAEIIFKYLTSSGAKGYLQGEFVWQCCVYQALRGHTMDFLPCEW